MREQVVWKVVMGRRTELLSEPKMNDVGQHLPFSQPYQGSIDFNTVNTNCSVGMDFLIFPREG